jgi:hypothetical protein
MKRNDHRDIVIVTTLDERLVRRAMPSGLPWTVEKLRSLGPGETFRFYFGHLSADIDRSAILAPRYHDLLAGIRETVEILEERRRITVKRLQRNVDGKPVEYIATGVALK